MQRGLDISLSSHYSFCAFARTKHMDRDEECHEIIVEFQLALPRGLAQAYVACLSTLDFVGVMYFLLQSRQMIL